ncbi:MAG: hypothetical protein NT075_15860 [Chloroflexi bacterium]|nr:hypothetical protein [Chloroflexota bacterium]
MTGPEFAHFSTVLQDRLARDDQVFALIALGSMAEPQRADAGSDHDFWVIAAPSKADELLADLAWLPDADQIIAPIRQAQSYYTVLYASGHVAEFAVFTPDSMTSGQLSTYRVMFDRIGLSKPLEQMAQRSQVSLDETQALALLHNLLITLLTGVARATRGEILDSHKYIDYVAVNLLLTLLQSYVPAEQPAAIDQLDAWRRCEVIYPALAAELQIILWLPMPTRALHLLMLADTQLATRLPNYPHASVEVVRQKLVACQA